MSKKDVELKIQEKPYFRCKKCGYEDYMGNTEVCPVCDPEKEEKEDICFFVDLKRNLCRQDGKTCSFAEDFSWSKCPKLEGNPE